jgi:NAD-specific glutamate dehydrogenase
LIQLRRDLAEWVLATADGQDVEEALDEYVRSRGERYARLTQFLQVVAQEGSPHIDPLMVAARQIRTLAE